MSVLERASIGVTRAFGRLLGRGYDYVFYAGSWIDETWTRTTAFACLREGARVALAVGQAPADKHALLAEQYRREGVRVVAPAGPQDLRALAAPVVVSATNGLRREWFHRSMRHLVHMPHSIVSLHMIYAADSFDAFDTLLACGPHHVAEFERLGTLRGLQGRRAVPAGYGKLDVLMRDAPRAMEEGHVLIAPSWGRTNILNTVGARLVAGVLERGGRVTLRPHPLFILERDAAWEAIVERFAGASRFATENPFDGDSAIHSAGTLVTDYSGIAFEFAALRRRPCVFVDVARKVVNEQWESVGLVPVEVGLRSALGVVAPPKSEDVLEAVSRAQAMSVADATPRYLFHPGACDRAASSVLSTLSGALAPA